LPGKKNKARVIPDPINIDFVGIREVPLGFLTHSFLVSLRLYTLIDCLYQIDVDTFRRNTESLDRLWNQGCFYIGKSSRFMKDYPVFSDDFIWGAAAASYQIEGAAYAEGKGSSVWDIFCQQAGKIAGSDTGQIACDHYNRYATDVALMAQLGLSAYRLSIAWPRVLPDGVGTVNRKGLDFYDRLIDCLLSHNIQPWVTLFHWDYPYALYCRGGWLNRDSADWFADYTQVVVDTLSDRVQHWIPHNEPQCFIGLGHQQGEHAPGLKLGLRDVLLAAHHSLLAHGKSVQMIRAQAQLPPTIGTALVGVIAIPATDSPEDIEAARQATLSVRAKNCWNNTWFADPILKGAYPADGLQIFRDHLPDIRAEDLATMHQPLDFYGLNIYQGYTVQSTSKGGIAVVSPPVGSPHTTMDWPITPDALYWGPTFIHERYQLPIVITENGMANSDWVHSDGQVHDPQRIDFLKRYLGAFERASAAGIPAKGYFLWSILDNFEWAYGYQKRFGLIHVDYATQQRTLKDSAYWYKAAIASNSERREQS
jgi:beta-glucosidase